MSVARYAAGTVSVRVDRGNAFVPDGLSAWEVGTGRDPKEKADEDYEKRTGDPAGVDPAAATFVFVTPRRWGGKDAWATARRSEGVWRDVRAYDADDIEAWLDLALAVHVWISSVLGRRPPGAVDLETHWADWSEVTVPATPAALVLAGRADAAVKVREWVSGPSAPTLALRAESRDEALAVFAAIVLGLPQEARDYVLSRCVVVRSVDAWETLCASGGDLLLIPDFNVGDATARATRRGHRVVLPLGRSDGEDETTLEVLRLSIEEAEGALRAAGSGERRSRPRPHCAGQPHVVPAPCRGAPRGPPPGVGSPRDGSGAADHPPGGRVGGREAG